MTQEFEYIGKSIPRLESVPKVTGAIKFLDDMTLPGMLYGKFLRSPYPHARVISIDTSKAESLPGVKLVLTPRDIIDMLGKMPVIGGAVLPKNQHPLAEKVRYVGDEVAAVAAVDEETAEKAIDLIDVQYEELPAVLDVEEAMKPGAPQLHEETKNNIREQNRVRGGNIEAGFKEADYIFEDRFQVSKPAHVCLETHGSLSSYDTLTGKLTHWSTTQTAYFNGLGLSKALNIPASKVRVIVAEAGCGGAFGGKAGEFTYEFCSAIMSMKLGKPVKMVLSREEEFMATSTRHPLIRESKIGLKKDGTIVAYKEKNILDTGAYVAWGPLVALLSGAVAAGPYKIPNIWIDNYIVYTNTSVSGAFRGFGNPQVSFVRESLLDIAAKEMGIDRVELRLRNIIKTEDLPYTNSTGLIVRSCGIEECINKVADAVGWKEKKKPYTGVGLATTMHWSSAKGIKEDPPDFGSVQLELAADGSAIVRTGNPELGQGLYTVLAQIAAEELGIPLENVAVIGGDTGATPPGLGTYGSRATLIDGSALKIATDIVKEKLFRIAGKMLEAPQDILTAKQGKIYVKEDPSKAVSIADVADAAYFTDIDGSAGPILATGTYVSKAEPLDDNSCGNFVPAYAFLANAVEVEVDPETGQVKLTRFIAAADAGRVINLGSVEGQLQGGGAQGIGYALFEDTIYDKKTGRPLNPFLIDYKVPTAPDMPTLEAIIVEKIDPDISLGTKGAGEVAMGSAAPAIANAIYNAIGVRIKELPITPAKVLQALKEKAAEH